MNETLALSPRLALRDLALTAFAQKARVVLIFFCVTAISIVIAAEVQPDFNAKSSLLVLLGGEHAFRPVAGQEPVSGGGVDMEQVLRTEASILGSDDLHRTVIRDIGVEKIYPRLLDAPGPITQRLADIRHFLGSIFGIDDQTSDPGSVDPLTKAVDVFARNLTITLDRKSSVIGLDFTNPDRAVAAEALRILETRYLVLRAKLYGDVQAPLVQARKDAVSKQLTDADAALQAFKQQHDISNQSERRAILLKQQGDLEATLVKTEATIAEQSARLAQLNQQIGPVAVGKKGVPNAASAMQGVIQAYKQREEEAQTRYRSPAVDEARRQILERETEIARMQATQSYNLQSDRNKTEADLKSNVAGHDSVAGRLAGLKKQLAALDTDEGQLLQLERNRSVLEDNFRAVNHFFNERQTIEAVEAHRESSVRVIQPPRAPATPEPTRRLIISAGLVVSLLLSMGSILLSHFFRAVYLRPEALEMDTGLIVLASVPEMEAIDGPASTALVVPT